ncbi:hypothetical protein JRQ81_002371 [Phrynocephalus forsythii]|uniref:C-type lectin domain-containing protein n=1 Tax=Phrynocephalus forsythii TaxID=171643 RepID=A0A9Q0XHW1_9SAUR|nr:hypothetical protein JRQ81_002371 [Phrynocephalus forsythii]
MATDAQYGNWLPACEPETSSTELEARDSPNTLDSDNVYDDTSFVIPKALQSQTEYSFVKKTEVMDNGEVKSYEDYIEKIHPVLETVARDSRLQEISASICDNGISSVFTSCPSGWEKEENNCYYFSEGPKNWTDALWDCVHRKAHMVSIWTDEEQLLEVRRATERLQQELWYHAPQRGVGLGCVFRFLSLDL